MGGVLTQKNMASIASMRGGLVTRFGTNSCIKIGGTIGDAKGLDAGFCTRITDKLWGSYSIAYPLHQKNPIIHHKVGYVVDITNNIKVGCSIAPIGGDVTLSSIYFNDKWEIRNDLTLVCNNIGTNYSRIYTFS